MLSDLHVLRTDCNIVFYTAYVRDHFNTFSDVVVNLCKCVYGD